MECISDKLRIRCFTPQIHDRHTETYLSWFFFYFFFIYLQLAPAKTVNLHSKLYSLFTCSLIQTDESTLRGTQQKKQTWSNISIVVLNSMLAALNDFYDLTIPVYKRELVSMHFRTKIHSHVAFRTARIGWCVCQGRLSLSIIYSPDAKDHKTKNACRKSAGHLEFWMCVKLNQQFESVCDLDLFKTNNPTIFKYQNIPIWKKKWTLHVALW